MLQILTDECVNSDVITALEKVGFDVLTIKRAGIIGSSDETVFKFAKESERILITFDRGFGDIFRFPISKSAGIIVVLVDQMAKEEIVKNILKFVLFVNKDDFYGKLAIIGKGKIRILGR